MVRIGTAAFLVAVLALAPAAPAQEKMTAEGVIKKSIEALGGADALKKFPALRMKMKGTMELGGMELPINSGEIVYSEPDKLKVTINTAVMGNRVKLVQVINGEAVRITIAGMEQKLEDDDKQEMKESLVDLKIGFIYPLLDAKAFDVKLQAEMGKVGDRETYVLVVKPAKAKEYKVFIDTKTFLTAKVESVGKEPGTKKEGKEEEFPSDYKKFQGVMFPTKSKTTFDGKAKEEVEFTEIKLLEKVPASEFDISD